MQIRDHHVHSEFSGDCNTPMNKLIDKAISLGMKEIIFTDHLDLDYPSDEICFEIDVEKYIKKIDVHRKNYKEIEILSGVEIGYQPHVKEKINDILNSNAFDFVICSTHVCEGIELDKGDLFEGSTQHDGYMRYLEAVKDNVENFDNYDVYGHLDFIVRYGDFENRHLNYNDYKLILDDILNTIIKKGKGIEVNTSGLRYGNREMHPNKDILQRYYELGGKIITLGSDSHKLEDYCYGFDIAINVLKEIGFKEVAEYKNRKPYFIKI